MTAPAYQHMSQAEIDEKAFDMHYGNDVGAAGESESTAILDPITKEKIIFGLILFSYIYWAYVFVDLTAMSKLPINLQLLSIPTLITALAITITFHQAVLRGRFFYATLFFIGLLTAGQLV